MRDLRISQRIMIYPSVDLRITGFIVGILLVAWGVVALLRGPMVREWLRHFPRSQVAGVTLMTVVAVWFFALIATMDLGEFSHYRQSLMIVVPVAYVLTLMYVNEFLAVRAFGMLLLLAAELLLEAAFLREEWSRLLLVALAYVAIIKGMFWVGMPYLMRDQVGWFLENTRRWRAACIGTVVYGAAILVSAVAFYRSA